MEILPLTGTPLDTLVTAFNDAFSDYAVKLTMTRVDLERMLTRRGYIAAASVGAFDGERLVGFTFNGIDGDVAYDSGTGVIPSRRRGGLARAMMERSFELTRHAGATRYLLEVLEVNDRAVALYRGMGLTETRRFQCWTYDSQRHGRFTELANAQLAELAAWCDVPLSWQNSLASLARATDPYVILGDERAAIVIFPYNGDVPLLAVSRDHRRQGLGRALLDAAATRAAKTLRMMNIDDRDVGIAAFLETVGAKKLARQIEMVREL
jgi:ribosomal protein S18 acetylase RimI-like enzyme